MSARAGQPQIRLTQAVHAPEAIVWRACTDPRGLAGWQADDVYGEVSEGGLLTLSWPALEVSFQLEVFELIAERRVVFGTGDAKLALELQNGTIVLEHWGLPDNELDGVASSWRLSLGMLAHYCEKHPDRSRRVHWLIEPVITSNETAYVFFTDASALATWLGAGSSIGASGTAYALDLGGGERMSGQVLANTPDRDLALSWQEDDQSVICLRTLPRPLSSTERMIAISWSRWSDTPAPPERLEILRAAHARLTRALAAGVTA